MSLLNENGNGMVMPVSPMMGGMGGYGMDGVGGGGWFWLLIIFVVAMFSGNWGFGGNGNGSGGVVNTVNNDIQRGFDQQAIMGGINGINSSINGISQAMCQNTGTITSAISNGFAQAEIAANSRQMAGMNQDFANQQALQAQLNAMAMNQQNCCCENRAAVADLKYNIATEACADRQAVTDALSALSNKLDTVYNNLQMQNYQDKLDAKNERIADLQSQLSAAQFAASQNSQTATISAGQRNLASEIEQYVNPTAIPAYIVQNPNCCTQNTGCGCGNRFVA